MDLFKKKKDLTYEERGLEIKSLERQIQDQELINKQIRERIDKINKLEELQSERKNLSNKFKQAKFKKSKAGKLLKIAGGINKKVSKLDFDKWYNNFILGQSPKKRKSE